MHTFYLSTKETLLSRKENDSDSLDIYPDFATIGTVVYHINGFLTSDFILKLEKKIVDSEQNDSVNSHLFIINSGGGESWYLENIASTISQLKKPKVTLVIKTCCSGAYYIASATDKIYTLSEFDLIGSIGTMSYIYDDEEFLKKNGFKVIELRANSSDLKNKELDNVLSGNTVDYIIKYLDPVQARFESVVRCNRSKLRSLDSSHPLFRGDTFYSNEATELGLIDGIKSLNDIYTTMQQLSSSYSNTHLFNNYLNSIY